MGEVEKITLFVIEQTLDEIEHNSEVCVPIEGYNMILIQPDLLRSVMDCSSGLSSLGIALTGHLTVVMFKAYLNQYLDVTYRLEKKRFREMLKANSELLSSLSSSHELFLKKRFLESNDFRQTYLFRFLSEVLLSASSGLGLYETELTQIFVILKTVSDYLEKSREMDKEEKERLERHFSGFSSDKLIGELRNYSLFPPRELVLELLKRDEEEVFSTLREWCYMYLSRVRKRELPCYGYAPLHAVRMLLFKEWKEDVGLYLDMYEKSLKNGHELMIESLEEGIPNLHSYAVAPLIERYQRRKEFNTKLPYINMLVRTGVRHQKIMEILMSNFENERDAILQLIEIYRDREMIPFLQEKMFEKGKNGVEPSDICFSIEMLDCDCDKVFQKFNIVEYYLPRMPAGNCTDRLSNKDHKIIEILQHSEKFLLLLREAYEE